MENDVRRVPDGTGLSSPTEPQSAQGLGPSGFDPIARATQLIAAERARQIEVEGWSSSHDRLHDGRELATAGLIYLHWDTDRRAPLAEDGVPVGWPWTAQWWKPKDEIGNLVRAGALFVAENDRLLERGGGGYFGPDNWKPHLRTKYMLAVERLAAALRDSDRSGEAIDTTQIGSTEGESAGRRHRQEPAVAPQTEGGTE